MMAVECLPKPSMIKVTIPTELEGTAYIQVTIQKGETNQYMNACNTDVFILVCFIDQDILCSTNVNLLHSSLMSSDTSRSGMSHPWATKLEAAQNVLFCKEVFSHLAREAVQLQAPIPHLVVGNQITASVLMFCRN